MSLFDTLHGCIHKLLYFSCNSYHYFFSRTLLIKSLNPRLSNTGHWNRNQYFTNLLPKSLKRIRLVRLEKHLSPGSRGVLLPAVVRQHQIRSVPLHQTKHWMPEIGRYLFIISRFFLSVIVRFLSIHSCWERGTSTSRADGSISSMQWHPPGSAFLSHLSSSSLGLSQAPCASPRSAAGCPPAPSGLLHPKC